VVIVMVTNVNGYQRHDSGSGYDDCDELNGFL